MRYSLSLQSLNSWKGRITESLAGRYIEEVLCPKLKNEGFDFVFFKDFGYMLLHLCGNEATLPKPYWGDVPENLKNLFFEEGFFPCSNLTNKTVKLMQNLDCATDGFLFKTKRTGETITRKKAFPHLIIRKSHREGYSSETTTRAGNTLIETSNPEEYPKKMSIVDGEVELIEVKSGKRGRIKPHQYENYARAINEGFPLRLIHVKIVSFEENHFEIEEKLITDPKEIKY